MRVCVRICVRARNRKYATAQHKQEKTIINLNAIPKPDQQQHPRASCDGRVHVRTVGQNINTVPFVDQLTRQHDHNASSRFAGLC